MVGLAVVGAGYWGPNLVRNFQSCPSTELRWVCDLDTDRARAVAGGRPDVRVTASLGDVLDDPQVHAVAVATPPQTHGAIGLACLDAGRHVLLEKPLAATAAEGEQLVRRADENNLVLMADHTYCFTPAVRRIRDVIASGELGEVLYFDSVRVNLGLVQSAVDVFWDLAPHDLSILDFILPPGTGPEAVAAHGADPLQVGHPCVGYLSMPLPGGAIAHIHVNWLSPTKIRRTVIGGSRRMLMWDDLDPNQRLSMYDKGVDLTGPLDEAQRTQALVSYRTGDMIAPALPEAEALQEVVREFAAAITDGRAPETDGRAGLRVLRTLEAARCSLADSGALVPLDWKV